MTVGGLGCVTSRARGRRLRRCVRPAAVAGDAVRVALGQRLLLGAVAGRACRRRLRRRMGRVRVAVRTVRVPRRRGDVRFRRVAPGAKRGRCRGRLLVRGVAVETARGRVMGLVVARLARERLLAIGETMRRVTRGARAGMRHVLVRVARTAVRWFIRPMRWMTRRARRVPGGREDRLVGMARGARGRTLRGERVRRVAGRAARVAGQH